MTPSAASPTTAEPLSAAEREDLRRRLRDAAASKEGDWIRAPSSSEVLRLLQERDRLADALRGELDGPGHDWGAHIQSMCGACQRQKIARSALSQDREGAGE